MKRSLYLDDSRMPDLHFKEDGSWTVVRNYDQFVNYILDNGIPDIISFDHDLADEHVNDLLSDENFDRLDEDVILNYSQYREKTGYDAACWLIEHCAAHNLDLNEVYVHSMNPVGAENIMAAINCFFRYRRKPQTCKRKF